MRRVAVLVSLMAFGAGCTGHLTLPGALPGAGGSDVGLGTGGGGGGAAGFDGTLGQGGLGGYGGSAGTPSSCIAQAKPVQFTQPPPDLIFVVGRPNSMSTSFGDTNRMSAVQDSLRTLVSQNRNAVNFGYIEFPSNRSCMNGCCADDPSVILPSPLSFNAIAAALKCSGGPCVVDSDARPIGDSFRSAGSVFSSLTTTHSDRYVVLLTDDGPGCGSEDPSACSFTKNPLADLSRASITTLVVGIGQNADQDMCLKDISLAGGGSTMQGGGSMYQAHNPGQLTDSLNRIVNLVRATNCTLVLQPVPTNPDKVSVTAKGVQIPKDLTRLDGWSYTDTKNSVIQVYGDSCQTLRGSAFADIGVWSGCPPSSP